MLRDKLHHLSAQLAEAQLRVTDLETEKQELWTSTILQRELERVEREEDRKKFESLRQPTIVIQHVPC